MALFYLLSVSMNEVHSACHDSENGLPSRRPVIEMTIPSTLDNTISPPGTHSPPFACLGFEL